MGNEWIGRREALRQTCHMRAEMRFLDERAPLQCTVTDISASGARIELPEGVECPEDFDLFVPSRSETKIAKVRRQEGTSVGVAFLKSRHDGPLVMQSILERLGRLERGFADLATAQATTKAPTPDGDAQRPYAGDSTPDPVAAPVEQIERRLDTLAESLADLQTTFVMATARREPQADHGADIQTLKSQIGDLTAAMGAMLSNAAPEAPQPLQPSHEIADLQAEMARLSAAMDGLAGPEEDHRAPVEDDRLARVQAEIAALRGEMQARQIAPEPVPADAAPASDGSLQAEIKELRDSVRTLILLMAKSLNRSRDAA